MLYVVRYDTADMILLLPIEEERFHMQNKSKSIILGRRTFRMERNVSKIETGDLRRAIGKTGGLLCIELKGADVGKGVCQDGIHDGIVHNAHNIVEFLIIHVGHGDLKIVANGGRIRAGSAGSDRSKVPVQVWSTGG